MSESEYLRMDPFYGDMDTIECRRVSIVTTRAVHRCIASDQGHEIPMGSRAWCERAKVDGRFQSFYCCLPCLDRMAIGGTP